jgi:hypothetical protein
MYLNFRKETISHGAHIEYILHEFIYMKFYKRLIYDKHYHCLLRAQTQGEDQLQSGIMELFGKWEHS